MKTRINTILSLFFCSSLIIGINSGRFEMYLMTILWFVFTLAYKKPIENKKYCKLNQLLMAFSMMPIIIQIYSLLIVCLGFGSIEYFSFNLSTFLATILAYLVIVLFGKHSLQIGFVIIFLSWFIIFIKEFFAHGCLIIINAIAQGWMGRSVSNVLESHELVLAAIYYWCVYLFMGKKSKRQTIPISLMMLFMCILGVKRIGLIAIVATTVLFLLLDNLKLKGQIRALRTLEIIGIFTSLLYLFFVYNTDIFNDFLLKYGIDSMSRNIFYEYICSKVGLATSFVGLGRGAVMYLMKQQYSGYWYVHSDILKMYVELGFFMFVIWLLYYFVFLTEYIKKKFGIKSSMGYFVCITFTFILYLTDNTESYFICVFIRTLIPLYFCLNMDYIQRRKMLFQKVSGRK